MRRGNPTSRFRSQDLTEDFTGVYNALSARTRTPERDDMKTHKLVFRRRGMTVLGKVNPEDDSVRDFLAAWSRLSMEQGGAMFLVPDLCDVDEDALDQQREEHVGE